jgi:peptidoglycan hydrolase CwlO-like protein
MLNWNQESYMAADSDSSIAWHRAQVKKHRETLKLLESGEVTLGEIAGSSRKIDQTQRTIANLKRKIGQSEQIISAYERRNAKRPRATDRESLARVRWT